MISSFNGQEYMKLKNHEEWKLVREPTFYRWKVYPFGKNTDLYVCVSDSNLFYRWMTKLLLGFIWEPYDEPLRGWY